MKGDSLRTSLAGVEGRGSVPSVGPQLRAAGALLRAVFALPPLVFLGASLRPAPVVGSRKRLQGLAPCEGVYLILAAMSGGFELQPQDGGPRVALAPGETVIGRGPLLGVSVAGVRRPRRTARSCGLLRPYSGSCPCSPPLRPGLSGF